MASNVYDFNLPAAIGGTYILNVMGSQALVKSAAGGTVEIVTESGERFVCDEGQGFELPKGQTFRQLRIVNRQAVANAGLIFVGDDNFIDKRITGTVRVVDQAVDKTRIGNQFWGTIGQAANAGAVSIITLQPQAGKALVVKAISIASTTAGNVSIGKATGLGTASPGPAVFTGNKVLGGASSSMKYAVGFAAAATPTAGEVPGYSLLTTVPISASSPFELPITTPIYLEFPNSLIVNGLAVNRDIAALFDFEEITL